MDSNEIFEYHDNSQHSTTFKFLSELRQGGALCDVVVKSGSSRIPAHRIILASAIPYLRDIVVYNVERRMDLEIALPAIDPDVLEHIINFAYESHLAISSSKVPSLLKAAIYLRYDLLKSACFEYLWKQIHPDNVLAFRAFALLAKNKELVDNADSYVRENFEVVSTSNDFLKLSFTRLKELICRNDLNVRSEAVVFEALIRWVKADETKRRENLPRLLRHVRLPLLSPEYLDTHVLNEELIRTSYLSMQVVKEASDASISAAESSLSRGFVTQERFCVTRNHIKSTKERGYGIYSIYSNGDSHSSIKYYDHTQRMWTHLCNVPVNHTKCVVAGHQNIYFFQKSLVYVLDLKTLDSMTLECESTSLLPGGMGIWHQNRIYFFGGSNTGCDCCFYKIHCFNPENGEYFRTGEMLQSRKNFGLASLGDYIYITGGDNGVENFRSVERFSPHEGLSSEVSPMLTSRSSHGCAALNGGIYVCGGISKTGQENLLSDPFITRTCEFFDPLTNEWVYVGGMKTDMKSISLFTGANALYAFDSSGTKALDSFDSQDEGEDKLEIDVYNPSVNKWSYGESIPDVQDWDILFFMNYGLES